jgi:hypothetical protein
VVAAAAITTAGATEALAAPTFQTLTELNQGQNLTAQGGAAVTRTPQAGDRAQQFELLFPGSAGSSEPGFGSAFQLRNRDTGRCLADNGPGAQVVETTCAGAPAPKSPQLWQHHTAIDFQAFGKNFQYVFNRSSGRALSRAPQFGNPVPVLSSAQTAPTGTAASRLQLWTFKKV